MTKRQLIKQIHENCDLRYVDVEEIVNQVFDTIADSLASSDKVTINGFGTFEKVRQSAYLGVNPHTGERMQVNEFNKIRFTAGKILKSKIN